jgi:NADH-quinone oxidoreductase subunit D
MAEAALRNFTINFGAKHPGASLCLLLELDGEIAERVDPRIGLLHRGPKSCRRRCPTFNWLDCDGR